MGQTLLSSRMERPRRTRSLTSSSSAADRTSGCSIGSSQVAFFTHSRSSSARGHWAPHPTTAPPNNEKEGETGAAEPAVEPGEVHAGKRPDRRDGGPRER